MTAYGCRLLIHRDGGGWSYVWRDGAGIERAGGWIRGRSRTAAEREALADLEARMAVAS